MFLFRNLVGFCISVCTNPMPNMLQRSVVWWKMHLIRAGATLIGGLSIFYSVSKIPIADSVAITFLAPTFGSLLSVLFLDEILTKFTILRLVGGLVGVLTITGFSGNGELYGYLAALLGAGMTGVAYISVKALSETEQPKDILYISYLLMLPVAIALSANDWVTPTKVELVWLVCIGVTFFFSQLLMASAFSLAPATKLLPLDYTRVLFSSVLGFFFLGQGIDSATLVGGLLIVATSLIHGKTDEKV